MSSLILLDYDTLRIVWWVLLGVLLAAFAIMDGADLGVAAILPLVAKTDDERRVLYNVIGPVWEGNQVWLITAGGVVFAAWPLLYAMAFSGFYLAMMLLLVALIVRPVAIKYRGKLSSRRWRRNWDAIWCVAGIVSALVFGVAIGNTILGVPFTFEATTLRPMYEGGFLGLFRPFALLAGLLSVTMIAFQGAAVLAWKATDNIARRAKSWAMVFALISVVLFAAGGFWVTALDGFHMAWPEVAGRLSNPLNKTVTTVQGGWLHNYQQWPALWAAPAVGFVGFIGGALLAGRGRGLLGLLFSSLALAGVIFTFGFAVFPFLLPSSLTPSASLSLFDASASHLTLWIMLLVTVVFLPLIILYTSWVYSVMRGKVTTKSVSEASHSY
ncbi:cytochrome d ubiquinol oxidase subunit II [Alcaligenes endophyticus]|uniref:Cytochrome d ubiquinol oxidase subunit II n=1 Tax=Alcaligenes endophyticus TaxID=1929088 RepID=A0ABT8EFW9_9BURK|nr:cytochrome d ubiquinol oxidase subunit II [Alcaligenes endophyticus]MCX5590133.1 cytochrome d ubiquinol oxidase subunit II [Alcaligenes endophyticus]MDN4120204.1 cytochrome d ubiquinol oxidase subunit II [Alcaligenes endophyticus]